MKRLTIMVGISGAGKSTYIKKCIKNENVYGDNAKVISPDNERKRISGNISDQSVSAQAFENCFNQLNEYVNDESVDSIYWDATNLNTRTMKDIMKAIKDSEADWKVKVVCLNDSRDWELCYNRVKSDIDNGVDRSNSLCIDEDTGKPIIQCMSERYVHLVDEVLPDWCKRNNAEMEMI